MSTETQDTQKTRPLAGFHPCHWGDHFLHVTNPHHDKKVQVEKENEVQQLKEELKKELLEVEVNSLEQLNLIDAIERLGVAYHFEQDIEEALKEVYDKFLDTCAKDDLYHVSTRFRILRQHGFFVPCDVFNMFKVESGGFDESLTKDVRGLLSLYEACHVRTHGDTILEDALVFSTSVLNSMVSHLNSPLADQVALALHQPLHKGMPRVEAKYFISIYEMDPSHNKSLLKFAKLDFNLLQALHQKELKELRMWWKGLHLNASFSRDRLTEVYFWILGVYYEPQFSLARKVFRKFFKGTSLLDDTYDAYGTVEELELLTEMFERPLDKSHAEELPEQVKWCYIANVDAYEEAKEDLSKQGRSFCVDYIKDQLKDLCKAYLQEAKWCHENYVPTFDEYMKIALVTLPYPEATVASFIGMGEIASKEVFEWACSDPMPTAIKAASTIMRLMNDMGGNKFEQNRKHVASSVQCLTEKHGLSEEEAYEKLRSLVNEAWKDINQAMLQPYVMPKPMLMRILNLARSADVIYKGTMDGYTNVNQAFEDKVASILAHPIPL